MGGEGAHKSELVAEGAARRLTRYAKRRYREHPARRVAKWERKEMSARANLDFQKMAAEHPELASSPLSRIQQKWKLKRKYAKEAKAAAKQSAKAAKKAAASTGSAAKRAGQFAARHPAGVLLLLLLFLVFAVVASATSLFTTVGGGLSNAVSGTSYASEDDDLLGADEDYSAMERELSQTMADIERDPPGYDEYRYSVDEIGHNPYELASYRSAKYHVSVSYTHLVGKLQPEPATAWPGADDNQRDHHLSLIHILLFIISTSVFMLRSSSGPSKPI